MEHREAEPPTRGEHRGDGGEGALQVVDVHERHIAQHAVVGHTVPPVGGGGVAADIADPEGPAGFQLTCPGQQGAEISRPLTRGLRLLGLGAADARGRGGEQCASLSRLADGAALDPHRPS